MITPAVVSTLQEAARAFQINGFSKSEMLWMEELSKVYLCAELGLELPDHPTQEFQRAIENMKQFGYESALVTRLILYTANLVGEKDFLTNTPSYVATLKAHQEHWSQKHIEATHEYSIKRQLEDFMHAYFDHPDAIPEEELTYFLTLYFKHFYRLMHEFVLFFSQSHTPVYYGRAKP